MGEEKERFDDAFFTTGFHGFDLLEKEFRADGWYYARAADYVEAKEEIIRTKPQNCLIALETGCWTLGPLAVALGIKDSVIVCHGPRGCTSPLYSLFTIYGPKIIACTQTDERDALLGGGEKLKATLRDIVEKYRPGMIAVVETCVSSITKDDIRGICQDLEKETDIPTFPFVGSGFKFPIWPIALDEAFNHIIDRMEKATEKNKGSINYINFQTWPTHWFGFFEVFPYLHKIGIKLNAHIPNQMTYRELIDKFPRAELNVTRCAVQGIQSAEYAEKVLGIPYVRVPIQVSIKYTEKFIRDIAAFFGLGEEAEKVINEELERIKYRLEKVRERLEGKRVVISSSGGKNITLAQLAYELGMEVLWMGSYKVDSLYHDLLRDFIQSTGQDPEVQGHPSVYEIEAVVKRLKPDFFLGIPEDRATITAMGIPSLDHIGFTLNQHHFGFEGAVFLGECLVNLLDNKLLPQLSPYLRKTIPLYSSAKYLETSPLALNPCSRKRGVSWPK